MAKAEIGAGQFPQAKAPAQPIVTSQTAEVSKLGEIHQRLA